jgi:ankyrin repeat protein
LDVVKLLVENGADLITWNKFGVPPLYAASFNGHLSVVEFLVKSPKVDINAKDHEDRTALWVALLEGHADVVKLLVEHGADLMAHNKLNASPLVIASLYNHLSLAEFLVELPMIDVNAKDPEDTTALWTAASRGYLDVAKLLVENGADLMASTKDGASPLWAASINGHLQVVKFLVKLPKVDINARDHGDRTALWVAASNGYLDVVKMLAKNGADLTTQDELGNPHFL